MSHLNFAIEAFSTNYCPLKIDCLVTLFDIKLQVFKNSPKLNIFGVSDVLLSTQNVNLARFACNVERPFLDFANTVLTRERRGRRSQPQKSSLQR